MPTYDYRCKACDHEFELVQSMTAPVKKKCPVCGKLQLDRLIGIGAGFIIKGGAASAKAEAAEKKQDETDRKAAAKTSDSSTDSKKKTEPKTSKSDKTAKDPPEKKVEQAKEPAAEKKISGSTSTPTHQAREGRGVGNLVDAAKRRSKEVSKKKPSKKKVSKKKQP
ncbi:MAG: zinc ribbon domain-containing protein [Planctomycetes bacterium]|nr:zinc ribbon domain-containing protein [Planctomycetota bacterium]MCP4839909.1 zinc ribbon domain-containing protein [Planctomycetota bacterium]